VIAGNARIEKTFIIVENSVKKRAMEHLGIAHRENNNESSV
jgi:hypothetical protein